MTVVLVIVDGLRPDAIQQVHSPHFDELMRNGAFSPTARSVNPSVTLPAHMAAFHSVPPERHGVLDNTDRPLRHLGPGLFEQVHAESGSAAMVYSWGPLREVARPGSLNFAHFQRLDFTDLPASDGPTVEVAAPLIERSAFDFLFVYLGAVDEIGHAHGWMSEEYLRQVEITDAHLGRLAGALGPDDVIMITADHGGHDRGHGTDIPEDMTIPWLLMGPGVRRGIDLGTPVSLLDVAPTLAALLNVPAARHWEGRVVTEALSADGELYA